MTMLNDDENDVYDDE